MTNWWKVKILFFSDPGHGWGRVTREEIEELDIADDISEFSYQQGRFVFLEEDRDLPIFISALRAEGYVEEIVYMNDSPAPGIRNLPRYKPEVCEYHRRDCE